MMTHEKCFNRFLLLWAVELISAIGSGLTAFALVATSFQSTGMASAAGMILLVSFLPSFLIRPLVGAMADRFDRRKIMIIGNLGAAGSIGFILAREIHFPGSINLFYPGLAGASLFTGLINPAYKATVSELLPESLYKKAGGLNQLLSAAPLLLSPIITGFLMKFSPLRTILLADIVTFLISAGGITLLYRLLSRKIAPSERKDPERFRDLSRGFRIVASDPGIGRLVLLTGAIVFFTATLQTLLAPMVLNFTTTDVLGTVNSLCALGIVAGSLVLGMMKIPMTHHRTVSLSLFLLGGSLSLMGIRENIPCVLIPGFLFFLTLPFLNTSIDVLIRRNIPQDVQGRTWAAVSFLTYLGSIAAYGVAGVLADRIFGPLLMPGGVLAGSLGSIVGTGRGRGIFLMFLLSGLSIILIALGTARCEFIGSLEKNDDH